MCISADLQQECTLSLSVNTLPWAFYAYLSRLILDTNTQICSHNTITNWRAKVEMEGNIYQKSDIILEKCRKPSQINIIK